MYNHGEPYVSQRHFEIELIAEEIGGTYEEAEKLYNETETDWVEEHEINLD